MRLALLGAACLALAGCSLLAPRPDPSRFYTLTPLPAPDAPGAPLAGVTLGLGPVRIPAYLDRAEVATRVEPQRVEFSAWQRWAEPLDAGVRRVLAEDLATLLAPSEIVTYPALARGTLDYTLQVEVLEFERTADGAGRLAVRWLLRDGRSGARLDAGESRHVEAATSPDTEASVAALSRALGAVSRELAAAVRRVHEARGAAPARAPS